MGLFDKIFKKKDAPESEPEQKPVSEKQLPEALRTEIENITAQLEEIQQQLNAGAENREELTAKARALIEQEEDVRTYFQKMYDAIRDYQPERK